MPQGMEVRFLSLALNFMASEITREEDGTIILNITIPQALIKRTTDEVIEETVKTVSVPGFRKGKAPKKLVEKGVDKQKAKEEVLKKLLPQAYVSAVEKNGIKPIINPRIHVDELSDDKDWKFTASTCEAPQVNLGNYKENVKKLTVKSKIILPGKQEQKEVAANDLLKVVADSVQVKVSKIIIEQEVERLLAQTLDEIKKLGLTLDQYLSSTKRTAEDLRKEYEKKALSDIRLEFALSKIAEVEKITVTDKDIDEAIKDAKDDNERKSLEANRYLLASIIRQRKTLDFIRSL